MFQILYCLIVNTDFLGPIFADPRLSLFLYVYPRTSLCFFLLALPFFTAYCDKTKVLLTFFRIGRYTRKKVKSSSEREAEERERERKKA